MMIPRKVDKGVFDIPLVLPESLDPQRDELRSNLLNAQRRLRDFARRHGWEHLMEPCFAERAEIYDDQRRFVDALLRLTGAVLSDPLPGTLSAALEKNVFMSVSPDLYSRIYPDGREGKAFEKLIAHEMAHRLHIRILDGDEDAMGPVWFFEGFAILASGQFENASLPYQEIWDAVKKKERTSYSKYGALIRHFLKKTSIQEMVKRAGDANFHDWLREKYWD